MARPVVVIFPKKMYERKSQPLAPPHVYYRRILKNLFTAFCVLAAFLLMGTVGFHFTADARWIDAFHNASMILSGMGPVIIITSTTGKLFSSFFAIFSGVVFISNIGFILLPVIHRLYHRLHLQEDATS